MKEKSRLYAERLCDGRAFLPLIFKTKKVQKFSCQLDNIILAFQAKRYLANPAQRTIRLFLFVIT